MALPTTWPEVLDRFARLLDGSPAEARTTVEEWLREAIEARFGRETRALDRVSRQIAFQKASGVVLLLEDEGLPAEAVDPDGVLPAIVVYRDGTVGLASGYPGRRAHVASVLARYFDGAVVDGPPWRVSEAEADRPSIAEYAASADFGAAA